MKTINSNLQDINDWAISDSGATHNVLVTDTSVTVISVAADPITVTIPDGSKLFLTHKQELHLPLLPKAARSGHVIPGMMSHSLVSAVILQNRGCRVAFEERGIGVTVTYTGAQLSWKEKNTQKQICRWYQSRPRPMLVNGRFLCTKMNQITHILV